MTSHASPAKTQSLPHRTFEQMTPASTLARKSAKKSARKSASKGERTSAGKLIASAAVIIGSLSAVSLLGTAQAQPAEQTIGQTAQQQTAATETQLSQQTAIVAPPADPTPKPSPFTPNIAGVLDFTSQAEKVVGIGHLRPYTADSSADTEGDAVSWLEDIILPLYISPGGDHWGWIYQGWLVPDGQTYLAIGRDAGFAMIKADENLYTFPVLDIRDDGWFQVQYTTGGSAWAHTSHLSLGEVPMILEDWEETLSEQAAIYFLNDAEAQPLRSQPEAANNMLGLVSADSLIEPLDFAGDWMRVRVTRPTANCEPLTGATVTEGWMRWRSEAQTSLVWYQPDGTCQPG